MIIRLRSARYNRSWFEEPETLEMRLTNFNRNENYEVQLHFQEDAADI